MGHNPIKKYLNRIKLVSCRAGIQVDRHTTYRRKIAY
jgi:hypothetical protein